MSEEDKDTGTNDNGEGGTEEVSTLERYQAENAELKEKFENLLTEFSAIKKGRDDAAAYARKTKDEYEHTLALEKAKRDKDIEGVEKSYLKQLDSQKEAYANLESKFNQQRIQTTLAEKYKIKEKMRNPDVYLKYHGSDLDIDENDRVFIKSDPAVDLDKHLEGFLKEHDYLKPATKVGGHGQSQGTGEPPFAVPDKIKNSVNKGEIVQYLKSLPKEQRPIAEKQLMGT